ncbi:glycosyltransferase family 2 protein [Haloarchaeobius sp. DFWS5]|uniref:glycosyltransferase family 2 protein n=1 Tax=Haloarchaeobius sp. DFWS5 TaxID=3446114 RepID=UPI003EB944A0
MYDGNRIGVVVPAYNEEGLVGDVIEEIPAFVDRVYVVDDASTDGTWEEISEHVPSDATIREAVIDQRWDDVDSFRVVAIRHGANRGVGGAIKTGYQRARTDELDVVAVVAGDGQMDLGVLDRLIEPITAGEAAYAKGNRLIFRDHSASMSRWRFFGNSLLSLLTKISSGYWRISDPQNGYTAISVDAFDRIGLDDLYEDYGFANHLLVRLNAYEMRVADVSIPAKYGDEKSGIRYRTFVPKLAALLLTTFLWRLKTRYLVFEFHPLVCYYVIGVLAVLAGTVSGLVGLWNLTTQGSVGLSLVGVCLLWLFGGYALSTGMQLDRDQGEELELRRYEHSDESRSDESPSAVEEPATGPVVSTQEMPAEQPTESP